ncbi:MAG: hypothetical protein KDK70_06450 [Myxococcales bacterium]|nr:hypothetical protein [Myxococcales bacterium]
MFKDLLDRAKRVAEEHLPSDVLEAGRKLGRTVAAHAPAPIAEVLHYVTEESEQAKAEAEAAAAKAKDAGGSQRAKAEGAKSEGAKSEGAKSEGAKSEAESEAESEAAKAEAAGPEGTGEASETPRKPSQTITDEVAAVTDDPPAPAEAARLGPLREDPQAVLARVKAKAEHGLKPEDRLVVIYATPAEQEEVEAIEKILEGVEAEVRHNDLRREPQTARQLATLTGVMVPPYVFINGRHWGNRYDLESLAAWGDLPSVVANRLDEISEDARRLGKVHDSFRDEISVSNILERWKLGHILCVDDLDSWYESDREGERFYYQGGPRPVADMQAVAEQIVAAVEAEQIEAVWQLEPSVHLP